MADTVSEIRAEPAARPKCIRPPPMSQPDRQLERFGNYWGESMIVNETAIMDDNGNLLAAAGRSANSCIAGPTS